MGTDWIPRTKQLFVRWLLDHRICSFYVELRRRGSGLRLPLVVSDTRLLAVGVASAPLFRPAFIHGVLGTYLHLPVVILLLDIYITPQQVIGAHVSLY